MPTREKIADVVAGQPGRQHRKQFVRSIKETAARAAVTATVTFAVGWVLKRMFENSVDDAANKGARTGAQNKAAQDEPAKDGDSNFGEKSKDGGKADPNAGRPTPGNQARPMTDNEAIDTSSNDSMDASDPPAIPSTHGSDPSPSSLSPEEVGKRSSSDSENPDRDQAERN